MMSNTGALMVILTGLNVALFILTLQLWRRSLVNVFKVGYYEAKLENMGVDISAVKNMSSLSKILSYKD